MSNLRMNRIIRSKVLAIALAISASGCGKHEDAAAVAPAAAAVVSNSTADILCSYAPSQSAVVSHVSALAGGGAAATGAIAGATGLTVVTHSSGAYILTGSGGYIAGTLGTAVAGPVIVLVGVAVGGSAATVELLCAPKNHPEFSAKIETIADEFYERSKGIASRTITSSTPVIAKLKTSTLKVGTEAIEYAGRKSVEVSDAVLGKID